MFVFNVCWMLTICWGMLVGYWMYLLDDNEILDGCWTYVLEVAWMFVGYLRCWCSVGSGRRGGGARVTLGMGRVPACFISG